MFGTSAIWGGHPEKCLAVAAPWAAAHPGSVHLLLRGLLQAQLICERAGAGPEIASLLAEQPLGLPFAASRASLPGGKATEQIQFHTGAVWFPWRSHAAWFLAQMRRWGWLSSTVDIAEAARRVYRPDLLASAALDERLSWPDVDTKREGSHSTPWMQPGRPEPLEMMADLFCDGALFDQFGEPETVPGHSSG